MRTIFNRPELLEAIELCRGAVMSRTPKPSLTCLLIRTGDNSVDVCSSNMSQSIRVRVGQVQVEKAGVLLLGAEKLHEIVKACSDETMIIEGADGETSNILGSDSRFKVFGQKSIDFPPDPEIEASGSFTMSAGALAGLISKTSFCAARESTRYAFNGLLLTRDSGKLAMCATDGRRLALALADGGKDGLPSVILPRQSTGMLSNILAACEPDEAVVVSLAKNRAAFEVGGVRLATDLLEGNFPDYKSLFTNDTKSTATLKRVDAASAVHRAGLQTSDDLPGVKMTFGKDKLVISGQSAAMGTSTVNCACKLDGQPIEIGFNPDYLCEAIKACGGDEVRIEMAAPNRPGMIRGSDETSRFIVMPSNIAA